MEPDPKHSVKPKPEKVDFGSILFTFNWAHVRLKHEIFRFMICALLSKHITILGNQEGKVDSECYHKGHICIRTVHVLAHQVLKGRLRPLIFTDF
jgi:hypothetical protein